MTVTRTRVSGFILAAILFGWMSVDWGDGGCDPENSIELMVPAR